MLAGRVGRDEPGPQRAGPSGRGAIPGPARRAEPARAGPEGAGSMRGEVGPGREREMAGPRERGPGREREGRAGPGPGARQATGSHGPGQRQEAPRPSAPGVSARARAETPFHFYGPEWRPRFKGVAHVHVKREELNIPGGLARSSVRRVGRRAPPKVSPERFKVPGHWLAGQPVIPPAEVSVQLSEGARFPPSPVPETEDQRVLRLRGVAECFTACHNAPRRVLRQGKTGTWMRSAVPRGGAGCPRQGTGTGFVTCSLGAASRPTEQEAGGPC